MAGTCVWPAASAAARRWFPSERMTPPFSSRRSRTGGIALPDATAARMAAAHYPPSTVTTSPITVTSPASAGATTIGSKSGFSGWSTIRFRPPGPFSSR